MPPLHVRTAPMTYRGAHVLNITTKLGGPLGQIFAPSKALLREVLEGREYRQGLELLGRAEDALLEMQMQWERFAPAYILEMRQSYRENRDDWESLLQRSHVTFVCFCTDPRFCHRTILGRDILPKLGAVFDGEVQSGPPPQGRLF